jgi:glycerol-3-phosphate acyltransferase PlsY
LILGGAYLCGSLPTGVLVGRLAGVDVRAKGSGNVGATNVARTAGRWAGLVTLMIDIAKGALPVWVARATGASAVLSALAGLAAVVGHLLPVFSRFRGGKGVATAAGVFALLAPAALGLCVATFVLVVRRSGIVSLASIVAMAILPLAVLLIGHPPPTVFVSIAIALCVVAAHRDNLRRLHAGTEPRFASKQ